MVRPPATLGIETRAVLAELIDLWNSHGHESFRIRPDIDVTGGLTIRALAHHTAKLSRAVLIGANAGLDVELVPLVRLSIECAMTAGWLLVADGGRALAHEGMRQRRAALQGVHRFGHDAQAELDEVEGALAQVTESGEGRVFQRRCESLVGGEQMYVTYRAASVYSHAGTGITDHYLVRVPKSDAAPIGLAMNLGADLPTVDTWIAIQAAMLLLAEVACDRARVKTRNKTQLARYSKLLGVGTDIRLLDVDPE